MALAMLATTTPPATSACRQALVMALDVSSSVDEAEYRLQMTGLVQALTDPEVRALLLAGADAPVMLSVFEWAGQNDQLLLLDWTALDSEATLVAVAGRLASAERRGGRRPTAIGAALAYAGSLLIEGPECWQRTVDISGDGKNNDGPPPSVGRHAAIFAQATVNGIVIGDDSGSSGQEAPGGDVGELSSYFHAQVIHGPDAFVETALGYADFGAAMKRKLLRELAVAVASAD
jgi:hypothetical protein